MSNKAMTWAWEAPIATPGAKFVLVALADHAADHAGEDWTCFPSVERLMQFTSQSRATVERHLSALAADGWISRVRRRVSTGRLGVYDYVLHRVRRVADAAAAEPETQGDHTSNCSMDHASNCGSTMLQNEGEPCVNLQHLYRLTPIEPSEEPSERGRARMASPDWWGREAWAVWPVAGQRPSSERLVIAAVAAEIAAGASPDRLLLAARAYAADKLAWGASGQPVACHKFFVEGRWENFAKVVPGGPGGPLDTRTRFVSDEIRAAMVAAKGEPWVISWLDPCGFDGAVRAIDPGSSTRAAKLRERDVQAILSSFKVHVRECG